MSNELDKLHAWFTLNKLSLNISKTNDILFGRSRCIADNVSITMGKSPISRVKVTKFVGVNIDENLTWKDHISVVKSKLSKKHWYFVGLAPFVINHHYSHFIAPYFFLI